MMSENIFEGVREDAGRRLTELKEGTEAEISQIRDDMADLKDERLEDIGNFIYDNRKLLLVQVGIAAGVALLVHCMTHRHHKKHHLF